MISYKESQSILFQMAAKANPIDHERVTIEKGVGRILAQDILCRENNPAFDNSAMDGFALKLNAVQKNQWINVGASIAAGDAKSVQSSEVAVEIMTGAPIPSKEFDSVVRIEDVEVRTNPSGQKEIRLERVPGKYENIRRAGEDSQVGDVLLRSGVLLTSLHLMILATQGIADVSVKRKLKIGVVSTGKELVDYKTDTLLSGQIRNSTAVYLGHELNSALAETVSITQIGDDLEGYSEHLDNLLGSEVDIVISTGAVSMGAWDFVRPALEGSGAVIHFHKCAIRPGKPILFASLEHKGRLRFIFGIPGNPVSTAVGYTFFVKPFINFLLEIEAPIPLKARLTHDVKKPEGLRCFLKAECREDNEALQVRSLAGQASFMVSSFQNSNAWLVLPEAGQVIPQNTEVEVVRL